MNNQHGNYQCGLCRASYSRREDALQCEKRHRGGPLRVLEVSYRTPEQGDWEYPSALRVVMTDGTILTYIRVQESRQGGSYGTETK